MTKVIGTEAELREYVKAPMRLIAQNAFVRSSLWDTNTWPKGDKVPSAGRIARSQAGLKVGAAMFDAVLSRGARNPY